MRIHLALLLVFLAALTASASEPMALWPNGAPGETGDIGVEHDTTKPGDGLVGGKPVIRLGNVSTPTLTLFQPAPENETGAAVVVCPGGGYTILAMDLEGTEVCQWLNSAGVTAVLLKYRVPARKGLERYTAALQDAQRALSLARYHASDWHIDPRRIGIMGFSAGGHLSAAASTRFEKRTYEPVDEADQASCRPDFAMLIYPAYLTREHGPELAPDLTVTSNTPPTFIVQAEDDPVHVENSLFYYLALKKAKVPAEMHLFAKGGHGYGLRESGQAVISWPKRAEEWMRGLGVLEANKP
ncbi:MAG TPA: alpha/beta hydrolase [Candidatus Baltobacteraceae bacterium]|jgi:acetyl esterase/lipase|nr:alpha/beta hydrolase [Candidatus Baltobacteraceae bacterium]